MDAGGRATHDSKDGGGRATQDAKAEDAKAERGRGEGYFLGFFHGNLLEYALQRLAAASHHPIELQAP